MIRPRPSEYINLRTFLTEEDFLEYIDAIPAVQADPSMRDFLLDLYRKNPTSPWNEPVWRIQQHLKEEKSPELVELYDHTYLMVGLGVMQIAGIKRGSVQFFMDEETRNAILAADDDDPISHFKPSTN